MRSLKIAFVLIALPAAVLIYWSISSNEEALAEADQTATAWKCADCEHEFDLTAKAATMELARAGGTMPLHCPACKKKEAYRVSTCLVCETKYFSTDVPGGTGMCPKCYPTSPEKDEENELPEKNDPDYDPPPPSV
ncbi:MAG: hypothetical protein MI923_10345 [Phycisphaerales bacterium]|nr:hypothetical protein [Phycisphaerales bacterium]